MGALLAQFLHIHHMLKSLKNFCGHSLVLLKLVDISFVWVFPKLDTVFQMCSHICCSEDNNHLPLIAEHGFSNTALCVVGLFCCKGALLIRVHLVFLRLFSAKLQPPQKGPSCTDVWGYVSCGAGLCISLCYIL